jgi:phospholipid-binding lipoprotein MlaA
MPLAWPLLLSILLSMLLAVGCASPGEPADNEPQNPSPAEQNNADMEGPHVIEGVEDDEEVDPDVVAYREYRDPLIHLNRAVFAFNDVALTYLLIPASKGYMWAVPGPVRTGIGNFFYNLFTPVYAGNHLLQLEFRGLGVNILRFGINTTIGLLGFFDPAEAWFGLDRRETSFEDTLAHYGAGYGIYLVLPFLGPSDLRNSTSLVVDYFLSPVVYLTDNPETTLIHAFDFFQDFAPGAEEIETLREEPDDPYIFFRNLYLQGVQRDAEH